MRRSAPSPRRATAMLLLAVLGLVAAACGDDGAADPVAAEPTTADSAAEAEPTLGTTGIRVVSPAGADELRAASTDLVVLDVRTPAEYAEGHVEGAVLIDFYAPDFADRLAGLPRDDSYVVYCRSGNRSGQARAIMEQLGFTDVADVDGGITAWTAAGLPVTTG